MQLRLDSSGPPATVLIRLMVGCVFFFEGIQKFTDPAARGAGRFERIGLPIPDLLGPFVGGVEVLCGALVLLGLLTRYAAVPLLITMLVAIATTKVPILLGESYWGLSLRKLDSYGFLSMAHEARTDFAMLLGALFLIWVGSGPWAVDRALARGRAD